MKKCPYCANPVPENDKRCMFCGRNLDFELAKKLEKQKVKREEFYKAAKTTLIFLIVFAVTTVATLWVAIYSPIGSIANQAATETAVAESYCSVSEMSTAAHQLIDLNDQWSDIMALAVSVDRDRVAVQVSQLQEIRRKAKDVEPPVCLKNAKTSLIEGMEAHIEGLLAHIRGERIEEVNRLITQGNQKMNYFADEVERLQRCAPDCW